MLDELATDKSLERFRIEYEKLFRALKKAHGARRWQCVKVVVVGCGGVPGRGEASVAWVGQRADTLDDIVSESHFND